VKKRRKRRIGRRYIKKKKLSPTKGKREGRQYGQESRTLSRFKKARDGGGRRGLGKKK